MSYDNKTYHSVPKECRVATEYDIADDHCMMITDLCVPEEWRIATEYDIADDPQRPHVLGTG